MATWVLDPTGIKEETTRIVVWKDDHMFTQLVNRAISPASLSGHAKAGMLRRLRRECPEVTLVLSSELDSDEAPRAGRLFTPFEAGVWIDSTELAKQIFRGRRPFRSVWLLDVIDSERTDDLGKQSLRLWREILAIEDLLRTDDSVDGTEHNQHYLAIYTQTRDREREQLRNLMKVFPPDNQSWPGPQRGLEEDVYHADSTDDTNELFAKIRQWLACT